MTTIIIIIHQIKLYTHHTCHQHEFVDEVDADDDVDDFEEDFVWHFPLDLLIVVVVVTG